MRRARAYARGDEAGRLRAVHCLRLVRLVRPLLRELVVHGAIEAIDSTDLRVWHLKTVHAAEANQLDVRESATRAGSASTFER